MATASATNLELPSAQALQSAEQMKLFDAIDDLRAIKLDEITSLPQLIVCGDQSSGKSSVLEAISGIPFPRKDGVCTRFATEVILRRDSKMSMKVSITPSEDLPSQEQERLGSFKYNVASKDDFAALFEKAKEAMGISDQGTSFSKSILRVEYHGPQQPQLTLVDLPGLIHSRTGPQTKEDIQLVNNLVGKYLNNPRSVILAVVSAKYDVNNQIITEKVRDVDPQGKRALGIITKLDKLDSHETDNWLKVARNEVVKFDLGWHAVKNLDSGENASQKDRDEEEKDFFQNSDFSVLPSQNIGITTLRTRLSKVLFHQIQSTLPKLLEDIEARIRATKAAREKLGPSRSTPLAQRNYLIKLSQSFYTICLNAIGGHYDHEFFKEDFDKSKRLCAIIMNKHFQFAKELDEVGASWKIIDDEADDETDDEDEVDAEIVDVAHRTRKQAIQEACKALKDSRGPELPGLSNPNLVGELFRDYSHPWEGIARNHIMDVWNSTKTFLELVLHHLTDDEVCDKILNVWLNRLMDERLTAANDKLDELLEVHNDHPITLNVDFVENRRKIQIERHEVPNGNIDMAAAEEAFDNMNAYYMVAMKRFIDNVPTLAIRAPIVKKIPGMLSPETVSTLMDDDLVKSIAGESEKKDQERKDTLRKLDKLEKGAQICRQYALRTSSTSRPAEGSSNVGTQQDPVSNRAQKGKGRDSSGRRHSPSVSEDGRTMSRNEGLNFGQAPSRASGNPFSVQDAANIERPASAGWKSTLGPDGSKPTGSGLFSHLQPSGESSTGGSSPFGISKPTHTSTTGSSNFFISAPKETSTVGGGLFGDLSSSKPPGSSGFGLFGSRLSASSGSMSSNTTGRTEPSLFGSLTAKSGLGTSSGITTVPNEPATTSASSIFADLGSNPAPTSNSGSSSSNPAVTTGIFLSDKDPKLPLFGSTSSLGTSDKTSQNRRKNNIFSDSDISRMKEVSTAYKTYFGKFEPHKEVEPGHWSGNIQCFQTITSDLFFRKFSFEELRLADYADEYINECRIETGSYRNRNSSGNFPFAAYDKKTTDELAGRFQVRLNPSNYVL